MQVEGTKGQRTSMKTRVVGSESKNWTRWRREETGKRRLHLLESVTVSSVAESLVTSQKCLVLKKSQGKI